MNDFPVKSNAPAAKHPVALGVCLMCASARGRITLERGFHSNPRTQTMALYPEEKLSILQAIDRGRKWHSLDDRRVCVLCDRTITGRQIEFTAEADGTYSVHCPTPGCRSLPSDWFYQGNASSTSKPPTIGTREVSIWSS